MLTVQARLDPQDVIAPVSPRLFGSFVEHMGRSVYGGLYEPDHPGADTNGFRTDVIELVRKLGVTIVRYPGGNFVSGYRWEDGVGPRDDRPTRLDLAWHSRESNAFGLDEFVRWARAVGVEPMLTLNLGTRGLAEAIDLLEYANHPGGSEISDRRRAHGAAEPYGIGTWCLGNEPDGSWQLGHMTAEEYGRLAAETARAMRQYDPGLRLVVAGSSAASMPTFGAWERTVLGATWELVDEVSLHAYYEEGDDLAGFLGSAVALDRQIEEVAAIAGEVVAQAGGEKCIGLAVDEWNVWYLDRHRESFDPFDWPEAPAISEDAYTVADAVVVGSLLISLLRHADVVTTACLAQLVNTIASIKTEPGGPAWRETTYYPFARTAGHAGAGAEAVRVELAAPVIETARHGNVPIVDAVATRRDDTISLFAVNRHVDEPVDLRVGLADPAGLVVVDAVVMSDPDAHATNTRQQPERVRLRPLLEVALEQELRAILPPVSWSHVRLRVRSDSRGAVR